MVDRVHVPYVVSMIFLHDFLESLKGKAASPPLDQSNAFLVYSSGRGDIVQNTCGVLLALYAISFGLKTNMEVEALALLEVLEIVLRLNYDGFIIGGCGGLWVGNRANSDDVRLA
ncbi:hypothetical protein ACH5RR_040949 [Cinchona calisaya]|uniref:Uncharacterized protein n=1 Tax=Cinchona calisaya TaxID=153742 RepID=A0ABD2XV69_9GENT